MTDHAFDEEELCGERHGDHLGAPRQGHLERNCTAKHIKQKCSEFGLDTMSTFASNVEHIRTLNLGEDALNQSWTRQNDNKTKVAIVRAPSRHKGEHFRHE